MALIKQETPFDIAVSWLLGFNVALTLTGYPLAGSIAAFAGVDSTLVSYPYRAIAFGLMGLMTMMVAFRGKFTLDPLLLLFMAAYGLRLYYDTTYTNLPDASVAATYFIVVVMSAFIGISIARMYFDETRAVLAMFIVCLPAMVIVAITTGQSSLLEKSGRLGFEALNPVSVGYLGLYALISIALLWFRVAPFYRIVILAPSAILALYLLVLASARGAIVGLALCLLAVFARSATALLTGAALLIGIALLFGDAIAELPIFSRLMSTGTDLSSLERLDNMDSSIDLTIANPLLGFGYIETRNYSFPHNLLIESGLALGFGGLLVMALLQIRYGSLIWSGIAKRQYYVPMMGLIGLSSAWLSSTLWASVTFWTPLVLLIAMASEDKAVRRKFLSRMKFKSHTLPNQGPSVMQSSRRLKVPPLDTATVSSR